MQSHGQSFTKDLRIIPNNDIKRMLIRIESLREIPGIDGCVKFSGEEKYRVRRGVYRVITIVNTNTDHTAPGTRFY